MSKIDHVIQSINFIDYEKSRKGSRTDLTPAWYNPAYVRALVLRGEARDIFPFIDTKAYFWPFLLVKPGANLKNRVADIKNRVYKAGLIEKRTAQNPRAYVSRIDTVFDDCDVESSKLPLADSIESAIDRFGIKRGSDIKTQLLKGQALWRSKLESKHFDPDSALFFAEYKKIKDLSPSAGDAAFQTALRLAEIRGEQKVVRFARLYILFFALFGNIGFDKSDPVPETNNRFDLAVDCLRIVSKYDSNLQRIVRETALLERSPFPMRDQFIKFKEEKKRERMVALLSFKFPYLVRSYRGWARKGPWNE